MAAINIDVGANTRRAERDIQKLVSRSYNINLRTKGDQPLGRITGKVNEFTKSLDASNARVIAFGASAGIIFGVQRAFEALASSVIDTQKSLQDINVILNVSSQELNKFGANLFSIAKNTGQSFQEVAKAATEFSRQGLGVTETLKRTNEALILSRLSGLDAAKSVEALTAAVNSYASQAVTATEIVNKFANVDAAFAVSSADLAEALSRVGSSAAQSGVSLNELIAIVTSAQQTTARGGAVIGNSFKTIFTRLQRTKVIDLLEGLGIDTRTASGEIKSTINLLTDLAKVYDQLGTLQQAEVAEKVGGVFQINILKAALADLGKEYSIYNNALEVAASTTDQAIRRNEELNKTYAAQLNALRENAKQLGAGVGERLFGPAFDRLVGNANEILGGINESDGQGVGAVLGKGILDGLGQVIAGPGLALIGGIFIKLFSDLSKFATGSIKELLGLNTASKQQQALQQSIASILQKNPELFKLMQQGTAGLNKGAEILLSSLRAQTLELQKQEALSAKIAAQFLKSGNVRITGGIPVAPTPGKPGKAAGYIPNFASPQNKVAETIGAYQANYEPGRIYTERLFDGQGGSFLATVNSAESIDTVVGPNGKKGTFVIPPNGFAAKGFIPNFAIQNVKPYIDYAKNLGLKVGNPASPAYQEVVKIANRTQGGQLRSEQEIKNDIKQLSAARKGTVGSANALKGANKFAYMYAAQGKQNIYKGRVSLTKDSKPVPFNFSTVGLRRPYTFEDDINEKITPVLDDLAAKVIPEGSKLLKVGKSDFNEFIDKSAFNQLYGRLFEAVINRAIGKSVRGEAGTARFEFFKPDLSGQYSRALNDIFNSTNISSFAAADLKFRPPSPESGSALSFIKKMAAQSGVPYDKTARIAAQGFIPNFASAMSVAKKTENKSNGNSGAQLVKNSPIGPFIKTPGQSSNLNTLIRRDHPEGLNAALQTSLVNQGKGKAKGFIPNFAAGDTEAADLGSSAGALAAQFGFLAFGLQGFGENYKSSLEQLTETNKTQGRVNAAITRQQRGILRSQVMAGKMTSGDYIRRTQQAVSYAPTGAQKFGAGLGSAGFALTLGAPIIAETIANAIGKETKEARTGGAVASGLGQVASFAGIGALLTPFNPLIGGGIGALTGGIIGLVDVIKQASTDLPELSEAARKASENLTKINDAGQKVQTGFEQIQGLRESGQAQKAGELEAELLKFIQKEFRKTPEFVNEASTAIINQDFKSLQEAIGKNTNAILENTIAAQNRLAVQESLDKLSAKGSAQLRPGKKFKDEEENVRQEKIGEIFDPLLSTGKIFDRTKFGLKEIENVQNILSGERIQKVISGEALAADFEAALPDIENLTQNIGLDPKVAGQLFEQINKESFEVLLFLEYIKNLAQQRATSEAAILRNTKEGNKVIAIITDTLQKIQSNYAILARQSQQSLDLGLLRDSAVRGSTANIKVAETGTQAVLDELFGVVTPRGQFDKKTEAEFIKINDEFANNIQNSIDNALSLIGSAVIGQTTKAFDNLSAIGTDDSTQQNAEASLQAAENVASQFEKNFNVENFRRILGVSQDVSQFPGFNVEEAIPKIAEGLQIDVKDPDSQKSLDLIRDALNKTNQELIKNKAVLIEQKTILANQKFQENIRALITSIDGAFGGIEAFLSDNVTVTSGIEEALANIRIIGPPTTEGATVEIGRNIARVNQEFETLTGLNLNNLFGSDSPFVQRQTEGRATEINQFLAPLISDFSKTFGSAATQKAVQGLGGRVGLTDKDLKTLSQEEILQRISKAFAEVQIGTGKVNEALTERAKSDLPEDLRTLLDGGGITSLEQITVAQLSTANKTLQQILDAIRETSGADELKIARFLQDPLKGGNVFRPDNAVDRLAPLPKSPFPRLAGMAIPSPRFAVGSIPPEAIPAMIGESIDIKNRVGGALPTDRPVYRKDLGMVVSDGEKVYKNFMGTGKPAVFNRDMQRAAEGYIPPNLTEVNYDLIKRANELNREYGKKTTPIQEALNKNSNVLSELKSLEQMHFFDHLEKTRGYDRNQSEKIWEDTLKNTGNYTFGKEEVAKLEESYGWKSSLRNEMEKIYATEDILRKQLRTVENEFKSASESLKQEFDNIDVDPGDFLDPGLSLKNLIYRQKLVNTPRRQDKLATAAANAAQKRKQQKDRERARTEAVIKRGREVLARSYEMTGDRYDIDTMGFGTDSKAFTVDAQRLGLKGAGAGGTFYGADMVDRAGLEGPKAIPRAIRTTKANAKFMLQSLIDAYSESLDKQDNFYNRPTRESMDQKRAITAKIQEFKRLYEQGRYESLREVYEKHEKNDPVKQAYTELAAQGIDPNAGYDAAMTAAGLDPRTGAPMEGQKTYFGPGGAGLIDGRPAQEVLAEGRANRPSDPAYDAAMTAAGLDPRTGAPMEGQKTYSGPGGAGLIDGRPAQEVLDELEKENSRIRNYAEGFIPDMESFMAEMSAGFNPSEIYPKKQPELQGLNNPEGDAYFNKPQEGNIVKERMAMANRMYIPNFANSIPESTPASISLGGLTINEAQTGGKSKEYAADFAKEWESRAGALALQIKDEIDQKYRPMSEAVSAGQRKGTLPNIPPRSTT